MAKIKMQCLISGNPCKDCALYRARHYYVCFRDNYRGNQRKPGEVSDTIITKEREEEFKNVN